MVGKQKQANRTKGNVRPSSSSRAAEQLTASGTTTTGFIGFGALLGDLGYVPTTQGNEEADSSVDSDFRMILRKLSKRDSTTKLKALQELVGLVKEKDEEDVKTILPFWPRVYSKISVDNDRRVRESVQETFEVLVRKVRRSLAPHLKLVMGTWLVAQNDVYAPAATCAKAAFQAAFPAAKQAEAINYCKHEVMIHIHDNLLKQTPTSLSDPKTTEPADMESKYQKMVSATLLAWRLLMSSLRPDQLSELNDRCLAILTTPGLWKHAKSTNPLIKGAFYSLLAGLCQYNADIAQEVADRICATVLQNLDETEPTICPHLWEAVLSTVTAIPDCWDRVNVRKAVWPRLWSLLNQAGSGSACYIYPNMLPLLSKVTPEVMGQPVMFYNEFFTNMKHGLSLEKTQLSHSEMTSVVLSLLECLRFCLVRHLESGEENRGVQDFLINEQLLPLLEASLVDKSAALSASPLYTGVVDLLTFLNKLTAAKAEQDEDPLECMKGVEAERVLDMVWGSLMLTITAHIEGTTECEQNVLERITSFLLAFRNPIKLERKKSRVRFSIETSSGEGDKLVSGITPVKAKTSLLKKMPSFTKSSAQERSMSDLAFMESNSALIGLVCETCRLAYGRYQTGHDILQLQFLAQMFNAFLCDRLLHELFLLSQGVELTDPHERLQFFELVLLPWLNKFEAADCTSGEIERESLIDMVVTLIKNTPTPDNLVVLELITKLDERLLGLVSRRVLVLTVDDGGVVARWFRGPVFGERVVGVARALCEQSLTVQDADKQLTTARWDLLTFALSSMDNLESVLGEDYVDQMLTEMRQSLPATADQKSLTPEQVNRCVTFVCDVATNFYSNIKGCLLVASAEALLATLFTISCQNNPVITDEVHERVYAAWQLGVRALLGQRGGLISDKSFFSQVAAQLKAQVLTEGISFKRLKRLGNLAVSLCQTMEEETWGGLTEESIHAFRKMLYIPCEHTIAVKWWPGVVVTNRITMMTIPSETPPATVSAIPTNVASAVFTSFILADAGLYANLVTSDMPEEIAETLARQTAEFERLHDLLYMTAFCHCILGRNKEALATSEVGMAATHLETCLAAVLHPVHPKFEECLLLPLIRRSISDSALWSIALQTLLELNPDLKLRQDSIAVTRGLQPTEQLNRLTEASLRTLQVAVRYMPHEDLLPLVEMVAAQVITCPHHTLTNIDGALGLLSLLVHLLEVVNDPFGGGEEGTQSRPTDVMVSVLDEIKSWSENTDGLLTIEQGSNLQTQVAFIVAVMELMRQTVSVGPAVLTSKHWDFVLCSMVAWVQSLKEMRAQMMTGDILVQWFGAVLCRLVTAVASCIRHVLPAQPDAFPPDLAKEWTDFFTQATFTPLLPLFIELTETVDLSAPSLAEAELLTRVCAAVSLCPDDQLQNHKIPARLVANQENALPDDLQTLLNVLCPLLGSASRPTQIAAYRLLLTIMPNLPEYDLNVAEKQKEEEDEKRKEEVSRSPPPALVSVLEVSGGLVNMLTQGMRSGDRVAIPPHSQEYTAAMAYLLSWRLMLAFFKAAPIELRAQYSLSLRDLGAMDALLTSLFHLLPENPVVNLKDSLTSNSPNSKLASTSNMFSESPQLNPTSAAQGQEVQHVACAVYAQALQDVPALVRTWWTMQDRRTAELVDNFTTKFVSPIQIAAEMVSTKRQQLETDHMTIVVRPAAREVAATYVLDEMSIELVVALPINHPLGVISVETGKRIGVANTQWRNWMLQMVTYLNHQNGSIVEGLMLWKRNVDKRFEGLDECLICFSIIHGVNYQLPRLTCRVCKKRFHSACLYKWFNSSNNSSCPLCRSLF